MEKLMDEWVRSREILFFCAQNQSVRYGFVQFEGFRNIYWASLEQK